MIVVIGRGSSDKSNQFFAATDEGDDDDSYFHTDFVFRHSTFNPNTGKFSGYWESREELEKSLRAKFPDVLIKDFTY